VVDFLVKVCWDKQHEWPERLRWMCYQQTATLTCGYRCGIFLVKKLFESNQGLYSKGKLI
jgi:hypothetical protein